MTPARVVIVGDGFRARTFARVLSHITDRVQLVGLVSRRSERHAALSKHWGVAVSADVFELIRKTAPDFVVVAISPAAASALVAELAASRAHVLMETPPADTIDQLRALIRSVGTGTPVQVAEQYHLEPLISAQMHIAASGRLGDVTQAHVSLAHGYHGVSLIRRALGVGYRDVRIRATLMSSPAFHGPTRVGDPDTSIVRSVRRTLAWLDFGDRFGQYDFDDEQYRSWIRSPALLLRGDRGELRDSSVRRLRDFRTPVISQITRLDAGGAGNHEGLFLRGYQLDGEWVYRNDFGAARLAEDELAIARMLVRMAEFVRGGPAVYPLAEAAQDQYLSLLISQAATTGEAVSAPRPEWAD